MTDPYKVLGISPDATDEEVKGAYRELARKYHPDNYQGNPLSDLANDKMQAINEAYDQIMAQRRGGGTSAGYGSASGGAYNAAGGAGASSQYPDVRRLINSRRMTEAEELLDGVPKNMRNGEWHYLKGTVQYTRGWLDEAYENFILACNMEPGNAEYRNALTQLQWQRQTGRSANSPYRNMPQGGSCSVCDICASLYCANCCCNCMGGGC